MKSPEYIATLVYVTASFEVNFLSRHRTVRIHDVPSSLEHMFQDKHASFMRSHNFNPKRLIFRPLTAETVFRRTTRPKTRLRHAAQQSCTTLHEIQLLRKYFTCASEVTENNDTGPIPGRFTSPLPLGAPVATCSPHTGGPHSSPSSAQAHEAPPYHGLKRRSPTSFKEHLGKHTSTERGALGADYHPTPQQLKKYN